MISSLLKRLGLRLQLLVGLLLVLGTFPEPSAGLECYHCDDKGITAELPKCSQAINKSCEYEAYCTVQDTSLNGKTTRVKGCRPAPFAKCVKRRFDDCFITNSAKYHTKIFKELEECAGVGIKHEEVPDADYSYKECMCNKDLCNDSSGGGGSSSSVLHLFNSVIITILTTALYNYT